MIQRHSRAICLAILFAAALVGIRLVSGAKFEIALIYAFCGTVTLALIFIVDVMVYRRWVAWTALTGGFGANAIAFDYFTSFKVSGLMFGTDWPALYSQLVLLQFFVALAYSLLRKLTSPDRRLVFPPYDPR